MENEEFERQISLDQKEKAIKEQEEKNNPYLTRDPNDGTLYEWDVEKKAWFPKIDDTFLAYYHSYNYQYVEPENTKSLTENDKKSSIKNKDEDDKKFKKPEPPVEIKNENSNNQDNKDNQNNKPTTSKTEKVKKQPEWFQLDENQNTKVYVSNLPGNITDNEFIELMQKCGLILKDPETNRIKIKLYRTEDGQLKGDGLCTYIKPESVTLALQILDGYQYNGKILKVERAKFEMKGDYNPNLKPRKRKQEDKQKHKKKIIRLFSWQDKEPAERSKREKVVILKNFFNPEEFDKDPNLIVEYKEDIEAECTEKCGEVKKVEIYDRNPEGVVAIFFKEFEHADQCVSLMNGRFFAGRQISAENWDGKTKYKVKETEEEEQRRLEEWGKYLEDDE